MWSSTVGPSISQATTTSFRGREKELGERLYFHQNATGAILGPQDSWLVLRGLKTLAVRMERQQQSARRIAGFLSGHPRVAAVHYPSWERETDPTGAMVSFEVDAPALVPEVLRRVRVFFFAESLGGTESLITFPAVQTHADIDAEIRLRLGINDRLLRLSVGLEDPQDLIEDLAQALEG
jgi:cystathionine beta-lyase/cystathionine gamma-synthase